MLTPVAAASTLTLVSPLKQTSWSNQGHEVFKYQECMPLVTIDEKNSKQTRCLKNNQPVDQSTLPIKKLSARMLLAVTARPGTLMQTH